MLAKCSIWISVFPLWMKVLFHVLHWLFHPISSVALEKAPRTSASNPHNLKNGLRDYFWAFLKVCSSHWSHDCLQQVVKNCRKLVLENQTGLQSWLSNGTSLTKAVCTTWLCEWAGPSSCRSYHLNPWNSTWIREDPRASGSHPEVSHGVRTLWLCHFVSDSGFVTCRGRPQGQTHQGVEVQKEKQTYM